MKIKETMSNTNQTERKHALLSPSSAHRWMQCTNAPRFEAQFPDNTSEAASEGTIAHKVCEAVLRGSVVPATDAEVTDEMMHHAEQYAQYVTDIKNSYEETYLFVEQKLNLGKYAPESFGTADCIIVSDTDLHVIDFKYGMGVRVDVERNPQLMIYALGVLEKYGWAFENLERVYMHIFQPRMQNIGEYSMSVAALREWGDTILAPKAKIAFSGNGEYNTGEWCQFCRGAGACKHRLKQEMQVFIDMEASYKDNVADGELIASWLDASDRISDTLNAVKTYALQKAMAERGSIPRYKVVEKRTQRRWQNEGDLIQLLADKGYDEDAYLSKKIKGITEMTKLLKGTDVDVNAYLYKPDGAPEIVAVSDKRDELISDEQVFQ